MKTLDRLANLIKADVDAGNVVRSLGIDANDRASLIEEIRNGKSPLAKKMKESGIAVAMPTLNGVLITWDAAVTKTTSEKTARRPH